MGGGRIFAWKKFAIGALVLIALVWAFGPRKGDILPEKYMPSILHPKPHPSMIDFEPPPPPPQAPARPHTDEDEDINPPRPAVLPTDPASDPDLSKTVHCAAPYKPTLPLVQYALMIDAGSTGSRIHIYKFNNCGASPTYEYEVFKMTQPGLSAFAGRPADAAQSLDVLLDEAVRVVPEALRSCTPVAVKATAGLRLLGSEESAAILAAVRSHLHEKYPFSFQDADGVVIMDGKDEGVYAWITANYLLNTIRGDSLAGTPSYAVLDLGGASTQIVFEPAFDSAKPDSTLEAGEHKYDLAFGGKTHVLYQHSYLGYGLMRARSSAHRLVEFMGSMRGTGSGANATIANPCLARGTEKAIEIQDDRLNDQFSVTMVGQDVGSFEACNRIIELVMAKDAICEVKPCSFNGVYQPSLMETFPSGKIMLLSYFYDRLQPFLAASSALADAPINVSTFAALAETVCLGKSAWTEHWGGSQALMEELADRPEWCLDLTFMHALLRLGYELDGTRDVEIGKKIGGTELGWCLGATLAMVGAELKCRV
ncbi:Probable guanosine-diphosphatase [Sparassis crispa]|uniref:guanosine-diphosphatase n=1 Tax=Sparassis crispa TaxID=139825 RepID=A0A401GM36_9APHY|nr:Probable guanosine-diphosphatase [Sparassis crispa]GBE83242.1 Probable guanosine-diphosphatase [Sparassis crispa]